LNQFLYLAALFGAKVLDNMLGTTKTLLTQRNKSILAGTALGLSNYIYMAIIKDVVTMNDNNISLIVVSVASGVGCCLAIVISNKLSKDRVYNHIIMSDDLEAMRDFRDFLASHHITNIASESYTKDWNKKTISITAYADTKEQSRVIDSYIRQSNLKFKRVVQKA
jgi:uncharacterized protein YebE (UPF0316 family)